MKKDVQQFIETCDVCLQNKSENCPYLSLLKPLPIPFQAQTDISMDFIDGMPKSNRYDAILAVIDRLTKYGHFLALSHPFTAKHMA